MTSAVAGWPKSNLVRLGDLMQLPRSLVRVANIKSVSMERQAGSRGWLGTTFRRYFTRPGEFYVSYSASDVKRSPVPEVWGVLRKRIQGEQEAHPTK